MSGSLMICGTSSHVGKSVIVAGLCRALSRRGIGVAPFKAQNMSLNSAVTALGEEIGRAQAFQAFAAGLEPDAAMNPILIKPTTDTQAQVIVRGKPRWVSDAMAYGELGAELRGVVCDAFDDLRSRFDVVVCEGAGGIGEFNLRERDLVNLGFATQRDVPIVVVADIDRGGSFASLFGSLALLGRADQALVCGFLLNKFRGDARLLDDGLATFARATGRPFYGVLPWVRGLGIDAEDALDTRALDAGAAATGEMLDVVVVRPRSMSNFTDVDPLVLEPRVSVRFTTSPADVSTADLVILPGSKSTVADMRLFRERGIDRALSDRVERGGIVLGICGGYQMLGRHIVDTVESDAGEAAGFGLLPIETVFGPDKVLAQRTGRCPMFDVDVAGYEIRHGHPRRLRGEPFFVSEDAEGTDGCVDGVVFGTSWHGVFECDRFRRAFLGWVADVVHRAWEPGPTSFAAARQRQADLLGDLVEEHTDLDAIVGLIDAGAPRGLPVIAPAGLS